MGAELSCHSATQEGQEGARWCSEGAASVLGPQLPGLHRGSVVCGLCDPGLLFPYFHRDVKVVLKDSSSERCTRFPPPVTHSHRQRARLCLSPGTRGAACLVLCPLTTLGMKETYSLSSTQCAEFHLIFVTTLLWYLLPWQGRSVASLRAAGKGGPGL